MHHLQRMKNKRIGKKPNRLESFNMKILGEQDINNLLLSLTRESLVQEYQPHLLNSLKKFQENPESIPPRTVQSSNTPESDCTHLFMPCIGNGELGLKVITGGPTNSSTGKGFVGTILVLDELDGSLQGVVNARVVTPFRTALASSIAMVHMMESSSHLEVLPEITVVGSGLQAYWHVVLTLTLFPNKFQKVNIINRSLRGAEILKSDLAERFGHMRFAVLLYQDQTHVPLIKQRIQSSSIILGCSPTIEPIIKAEYLNPNPKVLKYINLIGSYKPHMLELNKDIIDSEFNDGTKIIVDSKVHTLHEAGELIQSQKGVDDLVEIVDLKGCEDRIISSNGIVILKLVGLSVMDISIAKLLLDKSGDIGVNVDRF